MLTEMADSVAVVMLANGDDPTKVDDASFTKALDRIQKAVDSGQIRQFTGNDYTGPLAKGDLAAALSWSGDVVQLTLDNKNLEWNLPETGGAIWTDNMLIPKGGDVFTASTYMNFVYQPAIAAQIAAYINYVSPVVGAKEEMEKLDPDLAANPLVFPDADTLSKVAIFDSKALSNTRLQREVAGADRQLTACATCTAIGGSPYLLLAPGLAWLARLLPRAARVPRPPVAAERLVRVRLRLRLEHRQLLGRDRPLPRAPVRSLVYAGLATRSRSSSATRSSTGSPSAAAAGRTSSCSRSSRRSSSRT